MVVNSISRKTDLRLWLLMHRVRHVIALCEDSAFAEHGITNEQYMVLGTVRSNGGSLRPTDLAVLLERTQNGISMLIDRMVKAGLVRKTRDRRDHRVVRVSLTNKGANAIELAIPEGWNLIHRILSPLSEKDKHALASMLETVKCQCLGYLNPEVDMAEIIKNSVTRQSRLPRSYGRTLRDLVASDYEPKRKGRKKGSTIWRE